MTTTDTEEEKADDTRHQNVLLNLLSPPAKCDTDRMSSTDLAYIGDVVYEMLVRSNKVWPPKRTSDLQRQVVQLVRGEFFFISLLGVGWFRHQHRTVFYVFFVLIILRTTFLICSTLAEYQSAMVAQLREMNDTGPNFTLTQNEEQVLNRGRNAGAKTNHRKSNPAAYQDATALEALIGYLYISDRARCTELLQWIEFHLDRIKY